MDTFSKRNTFPAVILGPFYLFIAALMVWRYPLYPVFWGVLFFAYACILWRFPFIWLFSVPALLPVFDLAPWTGRFFFDEFDIFLLVTLGIGIWKMGPLERSQQFSKGCQRIIYLFGLSTILSAFIGLYPLQQIDANSFSHYFSHYNSLRVLKGFFWAFAFLPLLQRDATLNNNMLRIFVPGMLAGLASAGIAILWERQVFSGIINFDSSFRAAGLFSGMHTGGAYVDAYLAFSLPFAVSCFIFWRNKAVWIFGLGLFAVGLYSLLVTHSRIVYFAFFISYLVIFSCLLFNRISKKRLLLIVSATLFVMAIIMVPVAKGAFIQKRFSTIVEDFWGRIGHWKNSMSMMDDNMLTKVLGMGLGSYPRIYAQRNNEKEKHSDYRYVKEDENLFLRLPSFGFLYMGQKIPLQPDKSYVFEANLRSNKKNAKLTMAVCEKTALHSFRGRWLVEKITETGKWVHVKIPFKSKELGSGHRLYQRRPVELSFLNGSVGSEIDIDDVKIVNSANENLIKNGDFSAGSDFWFFTADNHMPWHIKNLWIHLIFEHGWLGFALFNILLLISISAVWHRVVRQDLYSVIILTAAIGLLCVGLIDSLFDFPRITFLFLLLLFSVLLQPVKDSQVHAAVSG